MTEAFRFGCRPWGAVALLSKSRDNARWGAGIARSFTNVIRYLAEFGIAITRRHDFTLRTPTASSMPVNLASVELYGLLDSVE